MESGSLLHPENGVSQGTELKHGLGGWGVAWCELPAQLRGQPPSLHSSKLSLWPVGSVICRDGLWRMGLLLFLGGATALRCPPSVASSAGSRMQTGWAGDTAEGRKYRLTHDPAPVLPGAQRHQQSQLTLEQQGRWGAVPSPAENPHVTFDSSKYICKWCIWEGATIQNTFKKFI